MASIKIVLRKKSNKEGLFPLCIRVTKDRKTTFIFTGQYINEKDWDNNLSKVKKSHPNSNRLNNFLIKKLSETNEKLIEIESSNPLSSQYILKQKLKNKISKITVKNLFEQYIKLIEKSERVSQLAPEKSRISNLLSFIGNNDLYIEDITESFINKFKIYLKIDKRIGPRSIVNHLITLRTIYNMAIKEGYVDLKHYPFGKGKIQIKLPESNKIGLNIDEVKTLESLPTDITTPKYHAKNVWLIAFYFAGMRVSDVLQIKWDKIIDDRLFYTMGKNNKVLSLTIPKKALNLINLYKNSIPENEFVFPELFGCKSQDIKKTRVRINTSVKKFNKHLKKLFIEIGINKNISMHIARHTFGNISGDKIPIQMLQKLYRHTSITTTINYQGNFMHKDADDALNSVIDF